MYSINGRIKNKYKETSSDVKNKLMECPDCGERVEVARIFGEDLECPKCFQTLKTMPFEE